MNRYLIAAIAGALIGAAMIWFGFNFRIGGPGSSLWLTGSSAYLPAMIAGALAGLAISYFLRRPA
ncbi:MAG: hypothetical protein AB7O79_07365 [Xanthobacteraceae bacterium]|jgi:hypothetical protein